MTSSMMSSRPAVQRCPDEIPVAAWRSFKTPTSGEGVTDAGMENIKGLRQLGRVEISMTKITDKGVLCLTAVPSLRKLQLFTNENLTSAMWVNLQCLPQLTDFDADTIPITDEGLEVLSHLHDLRKLSLGQTGLTDDGVKRLKPLAQLESLELTGSNLTDAGMEQLGAFTKLKSLGLQGTRLTDSGLKPLMSLPLENLDISDTRVTVTGLEQLKALSRLESLSLDSDLLTATGVRHLQGPPRLSELNLSNVGDEDLEQPDEPVPTADPESLESSDDRRVHEAVSASPAQLQDRVVPASVYESF